MKIGAENKRNLVVLSGLGLVAVYLIYANFFSGPSSTPSTPDRAIAPPPAAIVDPGPSAPRAPSRARNEEFRPVLRSKRPEDRIDPMSVDPTLRLDLLAKLQNVPPAGGIRSLFQFGTPPVKEAEKLKGPEPNVKPVAVVQAPPAPVVPTGPPPPPPINLKYYGIATVRKDGTKTAFFLDGEDILLQSEGDTVKGQYRVVHIGATSVVMEDIQTKRQQTLPLSEEASG